MRKEVEEGRFKEGRKIKEERFKEGKKNNIVNGLIKNFFNDSASQFASFFTRETDLSNKELEELKKIIDLQIKKQQ